ncbi:helix-hairpin-helix domain-containing protein [Labilibaculum sp. K2S]|uniref:helix-hairpin-helix domain-containing protein n=1 Tax=Labilibaculum sp. K2S TaxID=3056386 RepID=UPI0025A4C127|nr:helix-hairpin-helix domain-containing protein [Labilibaculum sp. K2S]MDM8159093.1 helix-hairpin-helix domain-containing protein [Labilibaculum sp. K2S]
MNSSKHLIILLCLFSYALITKSQNTASQNDLIENLIESIAEQSEENLDYSNLLDELNILLIDPINLNSANESDLNKLLILNKNQINNFIKYRESTGQIFSLYELQLIPGFSSEIIRTISPFVSLKQMVQDTLSKRKKAKHILLLKSERTIEEEKGYAIENANSRYLGNPWKYYTRYQYVSPKKNISFGFTSEKDKGEPFFEEENKNGFDFYSAFIQYNSEGILKQVNLGDYQIKFGQGLSVWSGLGGGKSSLTTHNACKSQGIKSYKSTDENQFHRGISVLLEPLKNVNFALFTSYKKKDGTLQSDSTASFISSIVNTGFHRNVTEFDKKHKLKEMIFGSYLSANLKKIELGISFLQSKYTPEIKGTDATYNLYGFKGSGNRNISLYYETQFRSIHLFGEIAQSKSGGRALLQGANIQAHPQLNFELIYRKYDPDYHGLFSNAFAEQSKTQNEEGVYIGVEFHPYPKWTLKAYYDQFEFPWLRYSANSPSEGHEYFSQLEFTPNNSVSVYFRYKQESKPENNSSSVIKSLVIQKKNQYRLHLSAKLNENWEIRNRIEIAQYQKDNVSESGYLVYQDLIYHFTNKPISLNFRYALFDTDSFNSRIYAYENDILYAYSVPAYYLKGNRFYFNCNWELNRHLKLYARYSQTKYSNQTSIGSGNSEISGNTKSEIKLLLKFRF